MLSNFKVEAKQGGEGFEPLPVDVYQVELLDISEEMKPNKFQEGKMERKLSFQFVVLDDGEYRGRSLWRNFVPDYLYISSKTGKNVLYQIIEAFIGRDLTQEEEATMDSEKINKLVGFQCRVSVKNNESNGKVYSNIESFLPKKTSLKSLTPTEKEKATPKKKEEKPMIQQAQEKLGGKVVGEEIPEIQLDDEKDINIDDVPF